MPRSPYQDMARFLLASVGQVLVDAAAPSNLYQISHRGSLAAAGTVSSDFQSRDKNMKAAFLLQLTLQGVKSFTHKLRDLSTVQTSF